MPQRRWNAAARERIARRSLLMLVTFLAEAAARAVAADDAPQARVYEQGVVAADHPLASEAGAEMLRKGGNVVDAAVATACALSVVRPESCGIGGGGFMVIWDAEQGRAISLDYRERAPAAATRDMFAARPRAQHADPPASQKGGLAVAVPGEVAGLLYALEHYGTLDRQTVLAPALRYARQGVPLDKTMRSTRAAALLDFQQHPSFRERFPGLHELYLTPSDSDAPFHSPLEKVFAAIARDGADGFYRGPIAAAIVAEVQARGGLITLDDLAATTPVVREPLQQAWGDATLLTMPPPSSGGIALIECLNILEAYEQTYADSTLERLGHNSPAYVHLVTEALKHAFADRAEYLGDTDFVSVPVQRLISPEYARVLAGRIRAEQTQPMETYGRFTTPDDAGTSHFSIIDAKGNAVAATHTINTSFGSYVVVPEYGIVLNNEMDDFAAVPGEPNAFRLIQSAANAVAPRKKPLSSMTPTIVVRDGKAAYAAGASGGPRIISATLQVLLNMMRHGMSPQTAVAAPRFHHQWAPDELLLEAPLMDAVRSDLESRGHHVVSRGDLAAAQAADRTDDGARGGSDPRKGGSPAGH